MNSTIAFGTAGDRKIFQNAWVVADLHAACANWVKLYGIGPFYINQNIKIGNVRYRGESADLEISVAMAQAGPVQVELIQQHNEGPSAYRDMYGGNQSGFHHVCTLTHDYDAD